MSDGSAELYDVAVIGAGPVGSTAALACAQRGQRVLVLEQDPFAAVDQNVGEWLHPPALEVLDSLGVDLRAPIPYATGRGFVVHPEDGTSPIVLPYRSPKSGFAMSRGLLVETLRGHMEQHEGIDYIASARAARLEGDALTFERGGTARTIRAERFVAATGSGPRPASRGDVRIFAGAGTRAPIHRIAGLSLIGADLPFEGFMHLLIGAPGPVVAYRIGPSEVRLLLDVPLRLGVPRSGGVELFEAYAPVLPESLLGAFRDAIRAGAIAWSQGQLRPRSRLADGRLMFAGDAAGSVHPMIGAGLGLGLADAAAIARVDSPAAYRRERWRASRIPETVAVGLAEVLADPSLEAVALRQGVYRLWRGRSKERLRTMGFITGDGSGTAGFAGSCLRVMLHGASDVTRRGARHGLLDEARRVSTRMFSRIGWMVSGGLGWTEALPRRLEDRMEAEAGAAARFGSAIRGAEASGEVVGLPRRSSKGQSVTHEALRKAVDALIAEQAQDGSFEGEVVWCPMLAAQYVLACHAMGRPIDATRRRRLRLHFERTQLAGGGWGLHEKSQPYLFVTTLVYVASRLLGADRTDPLLTRAHAFIRAEGGAVGIPSWGKLWLALVGLYEWDGVSPVAPELWGTPRWLPIHPSRYYCHTRLIYLGMATLYGGRFVGPVTPTIRALRDEIFITPYDEVSFAEARRTLRAGDIHDPPSAVLELSYSALGWLERTRDQERRAELLAELRERIRYELRSTSHTCISPVSGLLDILALHSADPEDEDVAVALDRFDGWMWEDDVDGTRVTGARSATWDTSFAVQALSTAAPFFDVSGSLERADGFLETQQIRAGTGHEAENDRLDPSGGYCFAGVWHGWPVSDCTAEAVLARLESPSAAPTEEAITAAARFILRTRNTDGGFGSYEARRVGVPIDWLNPSEMFGACMTERSYVECTASCVAALAAYKERYPFGDTELLAEVDEALVTGLDNLRAAQRPDGSWAGMWGVHFIYGTMFGIRGLIAGGVPPTDPHIRRACAFLEERQRPDGGWGEHFSSVLEDRYVEHERGQTVQTAWALSALLEARHPDFAPLARAATFLARNQNPDGTWDKQDPEGIFFHTALLEYELYRRYFPLWALGLYQARVSERNRIAMRLKSESPQRIGPRA